MHWHYIVDSYCIFIDWTSRCAQSRYSPSNISWCFQVQICLIRVCLLGISFYVLHLGCCISFRFFQVWIFTHCAWWFTPACGTCPGCQPAYCFTCNDACSKHISLLLSTFRWVLLLIKYTIWLVKNVFACSRLIVRIVYMYLVWKLSLSCRCSYMQHIIILS